MSQPISVVIFGEVLFDCFSTGEQVLGGAPFNVAWHLQALGDHPQFVSRIGKDALGEHIQNMMVKWGMSSENVQLDLDHPTGQVIVTLIDHEPHYEIASPVAYDFIDKDQLKRLPVSGILYHGSLGLRKQAARDAFEKIANKTELCIFLDVNLRPPWWQKAELDGWLANARWVKLNEEELGLLGFVADDIETAMADCQNQFDIEQLIVTRGEKGAIVRTQEGQYYTVIPEQAEQFVDTVGAGDAFTAVYIHGLLSGWTIEAGLEAAQAFASQVLGLRGATSNDPFFYQSFLIR